VKKISLIDQYIAEIIVEIATKTFKKFNSSHDLQQLKDAADINIWNLFNNNAKAVIRESRLGSVVVEQKKHIFQIRDHYFTFNKFNEEIQRSCPVSQLTLNFIGGDYDTTIKESNKHFEIGYIIKNNIVSIYINMSGETELLVELGREKLIQSNYEQNNELSDVIFTVKKPSNNTEVKKHG